LIDLHVFGYESERKKEDRIGNETKKWGRKANIVELDVHKRSKLGY